ncbi:MAG TPA: ABC transporter permease [Anaerolineaceae bacterium]|nr:ABC transporter permease [Anaerolineaceae bacterium]
MKILDIAFKDLTQSFRSLFAIGMTILAPLLLIGLISFAFSGAFSGSSDLPDISVGIYNADTLSDGSILETSLGENIRSMFFDESVQSWITARDFRGEFELREALDRREIGIAVSIPDDFSDKFLAGDRNTQVRIISDPTLTIAPQVVQNMVTAILDGVSGGGIAIETYFEISDLRGIQPEPDLITTIVDRYSNWYIDFQRNLFHNPQKAALRMESPTGETASENPMLQMLGLMMAGQMVFFAFFTGAYSMMSILTENENGTLARLFTLPIHRSKILAGKFLAVFFMVIVQGIVLLVASHFIFKIQWGDPKMIILALLGQVMAAAGLGVLLISFVKTSRQAGPILGGALTAMGMLGGLFTANIAMPEAFNKLAAFTPQGWVIRGWKTVLNGQPLTDLLLPLLVMVLIGTIMFLVGAFRFNKRFA